MLEQLPWTHQEDWVEAKRSMWKAPSDDSSNGPSGYIKTYKNLLFLKVMNAGHMVPLDVPNVALDMMKTFMHDSDSFGTSPQSLDRKVEEVPASCPVCPACPSSGGSKTTGGTGDGSSSNSTTTTTSSTTSASSTSPASADSVMTFVIAHSWIGALLAVTFFLAVLMVVRKRQARQEAILSYSADLEMKERYRDESDDDDSSASYRDELNGKDSHRIV
jgi:hypothetical protein